MNDISELTVELPKAYTDYESALLAKQQQLLKSITDLDRLRSLSLHSCRDGCLQDIQLATLRSLTRLVDAQWRCFRVSIVHKVLLIDLVIYLCAGVWLRRQQLS